jgi:hypothetical protein
VSIGATAYKTALGDRIELETGGQVLGAIPAGKRLFLLERPDPTTHDSTPNHYPGTGRFYLSKGMTVSGSCWLRPTGDLAYPGAEGITFRQLLVLVDEDRVAHSSRMSTPKTVIAMISSTT